MQSTQPDPAQVHAIMTTMVPFLMFSVVAVWALVLIPFWQIFKKAGFTPALSLLMILPVVNVITLYVVAFSRWRVVPAGPEYPAYPPVPPPGYVPPANYAATPSYPPQPPLYTPPPTEPRV